MMYYGWIRVPLELAYSDSFWDEMEGVFEKSKDGESFKTEDIMYVFGRSDWFERFSGDKHQAPAYDIIFDHNEEFHGFELSELV